MCTFIAVILPNDADIAALSEIAKQHGRRLDVAGREVRGTLLRQTELAYTTSMCDCGTSLGCYQPGGTDEDDRREKDIRALRKKGWSATKIRRWQEQQAATDAKRTRVSGQTNQDEVESWFRFITALLESRHTRSVGIRVAWVDEADQRDGERQTAPLSQQSLSVMEQGVLYEFVA